MANEVYYLIKDVGFPIAMCLYFMFINNGTIKENTQALRDLKNLIEKRIKK